MYRLLEMSRGQNDYVPISEILALANNVELFGTKDQFVSIIQALDEAYIKTQRK